MGAPGRDVLAEQLRRVPAFRALLRTVECRLLAALAPFAEPVLDLGCGDGLFAALALPTPVTAGIDPELGALAEARHEGAHRLLIAASAAALPFRDSAFPTVMANSVLEHVPALDDALAEIHRVVQPGGRLLVTTPSEAFAELLLGSTVLRALRLPRLARAYGNWFNRHSRHYHTDTPERWQQRLAAAGLTVERWRYYFSPAAHRAFDLAHYLGVPRLLVHRLTGRWVLTRHPPGNLVFDRWLRRYSDDDTPTRGAYLLIVAVRPPLRAACTGSATMMPRCKR